MAATIALASCNSSGDDKLTLSETNVSLKSNETRQLTVTSGNSKNISWSSNKNYVATVSSNGMITAKRVGEAIIKANDVSCKVTVTPRHTFMTEPDTNWGASRSSIISKYGTPTSNNANGISYNNPSNTIVPTVAYIFENDRLTGSANLVNISHTAQLTSFLLERYVVMDVNPTGDVVAMFCNGLTESEITTAVGIMIFDSKYVMASYIDAKSSSKSTTNDIADQFK